MSGAGDGSDGFDLPDGYDFLSFLGAGGGGWVVRARQRALGREVAVKAVRVGGDAGGAVQRLLREGRVLARLNHPGVVRVHQLIPGPASVFLVMELLTGPSVQALLADGPPEPELALAVLRDVAAALTAVHRVGVVHRDVKPGNIVLHPERGAVLLDFGLARLPAARAAFRSETGVPTGTPRYMAPEQLTRPEEEIPAMDAYAFGVLAYRLLLGRYPYRPVDTLAEVVHAHLHESPVDPRESCPALPAAAAAALRGALDKEPRRRVMPAAVVEALGRVPLSVWPGPQRPVESVRPADPSPASAGPPTRAGSGPAGTLTGTAPAPPTDSTAATAGGTATGTRPVGSGTGLLPAVADPERTRALTSRVTSPARADPVRAVDTDAAAGDETVVTGWVAPPVYRPGRARRRTRRVWIVVVAAALAGIAIGAVLAAVWGRL